jgi:tetratricopeptide (TPR) repeat protein
MRGLTLLGGTAAALTAAAVLLLGGTLRDSPSAEPAPALGGRDIAASAGETLGAGFAAGDTEKLVADLQERVRGGSADAQSLALLGLAFQQRYRETADSSYLTRSGTALRRAIRLEPRNLDAVMGLGALALSRHEFGRALALGRRAQRLAPGSPRPFAVVGDALVELGRYEDAFRAFDTMAALKPSVASYARVAYGRELIGRPRAAIRAMELALSAAGGFPEPTAWTHVELGKLHLGLGELEAAERHFRGALAALPDYPYALDGLARAEAARGRSGAAIELARRAVDGVPLPQFAGTLADLYRASGRTDLAREQEQLVGAIGRLLRANGVKTDLELALFDVDHGLRLPQALAAARRAHAERPSIEADGVVAWALARNGRCEEALRFSERALRLGTRDASKMFHRGMIERCLGRAETARRWFRQALRTNPHFSLLWGPVARRLAAAP